MVFHCIFLGKKGHQTWKPRSQHSLLPTLPIGWLGENPGNGVANGTAQRTYYNLILRKLKEKMPRTVLVNAKRIVLMPPGHPTILLKSNLFIMAAVSVKSLLFKKNNCTLDNHEPLGASSGEV